MQDYTGDNRRAQVFHSHPITVKGIFLARNSLRSTMRVSQRNKISLALRVPSHVPHTTEKKSDPVYSTPARAISQSWLNKDSSNWGANRDGKHLLPEPGPCWPSGFCLWSAALAKPPSYKSSDETASQTPPGEYESSTPTLVEAQTHKQTSRPTNIYAPEQTDAAQILELSNNLAKKSSADNSVWAEKKKQRTCLTFFPSPAWRNMTYPHFQRKRAKHLTQQRARRHLWTANPAVVFPPPVTGRWFTRPARLHLGTVCTGAYSLPAQTERGGEKTPPSDYTALWPANAVDKIMWPVSRCIILYLLGVQQFTNSNQGIEPNDYDIADGSKTGPYTRGEC